MTAARLASIPFEHVEAELAAIPLASEASFCAPASELDPTMEQQKSLWRAAERDVFASIPALPLDEFVLIRDRVWFGRKPHIEDPRPQIALVKYLRGLSSQYLDEQGRPVEESTRYNGHRCPSPLARLRWSWLCRALPPDLLLAARGVGNADISPLPLNPLVERLLEDNGFAELHLHLGAAADFSLIWANFMHVLEVEEIEKEACESPGACFDDGRKFAKWILWAAIARLVLAEWLFDSSRFLGNFRLLDFTRANWKTRMDSGMINDLYRLHSELSVGQECASPVRFTRARILYRSLIRPLSFPQSRQEEWDRLRARHKPQSRQEVFQNDPLAPIVGWQEASGSNPENVFVRESLRFMEEEGDRGIEEDRDKRDFTCLFWQVTRIKCLLYRHLVLRPLTPGLQWFVRFFSRISPVRGSLSDKVLMDAATYQSGVGKGLRSLEVRLGTEESQSQCLDKIRQVEGACTDVAAVEVGAVFHFSRDRGGGWKKGFPIAHGLDYSYPGTPPYERLKTRKDVGNPSRFRFAQFYLNRRRHAQALVSVLRGFPLALRTFRGIDLCADEAGVPIWVMAPLVRWVREAGRAGAKELQERRLTGISPPKITVHAGEDFIHLLTGLRRLDDAIQYLGLEEGDRIGHGLALGLDPETWFERVGRIVQTREERLFDLVWEWACYAHRGVAVESTRLAYLESSVARLGRLIFGGSPTPEDIVQFVELLHCEHELKALGFPNRSMCQASTSTGPGGERSKSRHLMQEYLRSTQVWGNGRVLETIVISDLGHELEALCSLQRALRQSVGALGLTVEVNPSSNLMIAGLGLLDEHPIWRLSQPLDDIPPLSVCIGSDDPLTFATNLPHEYQQLFDAMVLAGKSHEVALGWLDKSRESGMRGRFTLPRLVINKTKKFRPSLLAVRPPVPPP